MKVLINAASANMGGAVTYLVNVLNELPAVARDHHFIVAAPDPTLERVGPVLERPPFRSVPYRHPPRSTLARIHFDQVAVRRLARRERADVLFSSNGFSTFASPCPQLLLVRDASYWSPEFEARLRALGRSLRALRLRRRWSLWSIRAADRVIFPTRAMQDRVARYADLSAKPHGVIAYGFDRARFFAADAPVPALARSVDEWRRSGGRVLLSVSAYAVHKNFETLVESLPALREVHPRTKLLLTIDRERTGDKAEFDALLRRVRELGLSDVVLLTGHLDHAQLQHLYARADAFVFTSFLESFGQPMVEALASGLPVVAADVAVNRELLGDAALYFPAFDARACAREVSRVLSDAALARGLAERARGRADQFSWSRYAEQLVAVLEQLRARTPGQISRS